LKKEKKNSRRRKAENLSQRKKTVLKKVYKLGEYDGVDVALIIYQNGRFFTYKSIDHESWPLSIKEIVRERHPYIALHAKVKAASFIPCFEEHASSRYKKSA
jgi:hypothetical protein